jgi:hypothetical protein
MTGVVRLEAVPRNVAGDVDARGRDQGRRTA